MHDKFQVAIIRANSPTPVTRNQATKSITVWLTGAFRISRLCSTKSDASVLVNDEHSTEQISLSKVRFIDSLLNSTLNKYFSLFFFQTWHFFFLILILFFLNQNWWKIRIIQWACSLIRAGSRSCALSRICYTISVAI